MPLQLNHMDRILTLLTKLKNYPMLEKAVEEEQSCAVFGIGEHKPYLSHLISVRLKKKAFIIVPDEKAARKTLQLLEAADENVLLFPAKDYFFRELESVSRADENRRIEILSQIRNGDFDTIVISADALCVLLPSPEDYQEFQLQVGQETDFRLLPQKLTDLGYESFPLVEGPGQFSIRGGIADIYPPSEETPIRVEFFDNTVDSISQFDVLSQRRGEQKDLVRITPAKEYTRQTIDRLLETLCNMPQNSYIRRDIELLRQGILPKHDRYLPACFRSPANILDYRPSNTVLYIFDPKSVLETIDGFSFRTNEDIQLLLEEGYPFVSGFYFFQKEEILERMASAVLFETLPSSLPNFSPKQLLQFNLFKTLPPNPKTFAEELRQLDQAGEEIWITTATQEHREELLRQFSALRNFHVLTASLPFGFSMQEEHITVFSFCQKLEKQQKRIRKFKQGEKIRGFSDLKKGDYVVHTNYGVGIYDGIHKIESQGITKDFIKIQFAGTDVLYIPCDQLDLISKYIGGAEDVHVKLNRLGGGEWQKSKQKVKKAVRDLADQLINLYGQRLKTKGHAFSADNDWQKTFENTFAFEETEDQLRCCAEIKRDMEQDVPMDRLLCGDVGFGKTEVALRAIFKCICDNKQAVLLAPTTILAMQHYNTMQQRFGEFPIRTELLSRFRSPTQQKQILSKLRRGEIDVIVGTHRLVQKDIKFKDLGLIVIDEEQRFGVSHKEYLKQQALNADILTLSATPIPRTLNMSMSGIRDISVINEPPQNRFPITTYVAEYDLGLVADAIRRELARGGQCFYLHNRIETIHKTAALLEERTGARIQVAHGQMSQEELSEVWKELMEHTIDVLVCTTIIETGVDVPNCNTLIIEDADRLGLAQLHQIRGRVGRTDRRAYAYFTFRKGKSLSEDAYKRLMTIREYTEFGSGLKIAMRDLEIRGAGDILGAEQSGHLVTVGFDMYMKLLEEAVREKKGEAPLQKECIVELKTDAYLPDEYVRSPELRIEIYKMIAGILSDEDYSDVLDELIDRFGDPPQPTINLLSIAKIKYQASALGILKIEEKEGCLLIWPENFPLEAVAALAAKYKRKLLYSMERQPYFTLKTSSSLEDIKQFVRNASEALDKIQKK